VTRRDVPLDARRILEVLSEFDVDYTVIGGLAVQAHGHTRTTQDVDLVPAPAEPNLERLRAALGSLEAWPAGRPRPGGTIVLPTNGVASFDTAAGGVDVHLSPPGAPAYPDLRARALVIELGDLQVPVASRDDLIAMKRVSGRPIDRGDVLALTEPRHDE
jgi:hypothetical protein